MDPNEFLRLGEELVERRTPLGCRAAIGRAYYGAFNMTASLMRNAGIKVAGGPKAHQQMWQDLLNCGIQELRIPGSQLGDLHGMRRRADYEMDNPDPEDYSTAKFWVTEAREHIETIKQMFAGPNRAAVVAAIVAYRKRIGS